MINDAHFIRQTGLVDPQKLTTPIAIVGAGGIGSWATLSLLKMGCQQVHVFDFDNVELHNIGSQIYTDIDDGKSKVQALADKMFGLTDTQPEVTRTEVKEHNTHLLIDFPIVISAVDSITIRKTLFESLKDTDKVFIDGRMAGHAIEIYTVKMNDPEAVKLYESTLFTEEEALPVECSERAIVYNCLVIAGLMGAIIGHLAMEREVPVEIIADLTNFTLFGD